MSPLQNYVERLFKGYKDSQHIRELKEEILSNLEAKVADLTANGMDYQQAITTATQNMDRVDFLIDDHQRIYIHRYRLELLQRAVIYLLIGWIVTIPMNIVGEGRLLNAFLLVAAIISGVLLLLLHTKNAKQPLDTISFYNRKQLLRYRKYVWLLWGLFAGVSILWVTALHFGSNLWFARSIHLSGPYQFAVISIRYTLPLVSIIIPLFFNASIKLAQTHEAGEPNAI